MGRLTTHVLDTARGMPAVGLTIELFLLDGERRRLKSVSTNKDGRCDAPLLEGPALAAGSYELVFAVGAYFRGSGVAAGDPPFLDLVPIRFQVADPAAHYHVPLLVSPYGYTTYRGS
jgi:5-hydroxyisourate hydrolase